jgi:anti-sigma-K factor RskA
MSMNSSERPDPTGEQWAAYVDGTMGAGETAAFEREHPYAAGEKASALKIQRALRRNFPPPILRNPDFFNQQILREIASESRRSDRNAGRNGLWSLWRMALAGACCLVVTAVIYMVFVNGRQPQHDRYVAQVFSVKAGDDGLDATLLDADGLAVLWVDGLDQLPNDYALQ